MSEKNIIEGFQVEVGTDEIKTHLAARIEYHRAEAAKAETKLATLKERNAEARALADELSLHQGVGIGPIGNPVLTLQNELRIHTSAVDFLVWVESHLIPGATYRLDTTDLSTLEFPGATFRGLIPGLG